MTDSPRRRRRSFSARQSGLRDRPRRKYPDVAASSARWNADSEHENTTYADSGSDSHRGHARSWSVQRSNSGEPAAAGATSPSCVETNARPAIAAACMACLKKNAIEGPAKDGCCRASRIRGESNSAMRSRRACRRRPARRELQRRRRHQQVLLRREPGGLRPGGKSQRPVPRAGSPRPRDATSRRDNGQAAPRPTS